MTITDCLYMVLESPNDFGVRFWTGYGPEEKLLPRTHNLLNLHTDWLGECEWCPENGAYIYGVEFYDNNTGQAFYVENESNSEITFEDLMTFTEDILRLR